MDNVYSIEDFSDGNSRETALSIQLGLAEKEDNGYIIPAREVTKGQIQPGEIHQAAIIQTQVTNSLETKIKPSWDHLLKKMSAILLRSRTLATK